MIQYSFWDMLRTLIFASRFTFILFFVGLLGGAAIAAAIVTMRLSSGKIRRTIAWLYVEFFQGTPLLMQLYVLFFGIAAIGWRLPAWLAAGLALITWSGAFLSEIWRGSIEAVHKGQWEASSSLGMGYFQQLRYIILPQAWLLALGPTVGFLVDIIKATAVTSIIGYIELFQAGTAIANATFQPFNAYTLVAAIYFLLCWPISLLSRKIEEKYNGNHSS